ncbi:FAD dependent oxidoreductase [Aspergillus californicus]
MASIVYEPALKDPGLPVANPTKSFWLQDPVSPGTTHTAWVDRADIVVIGSGITAASFLLKLHQLNPRLSAVVVEARDLASGATGRNGGHIKPSVYTEWTERKRKYGLHEAIRLTRFEDGHLEEISRFIHDNAVECDLKIQGSLDAYFDGETFQDAVEAVRDMKKHVPDIANKYEIYTSAEDLLALGFSPACVGAVGFAAASLWPYKLVSWVYRLLAAKGYRIQQNCAVTGVDEGPDLAVISTTRGTIRALKAVHASNGYMGHLLPQLRPYISPVRGNVVRLRAAREEPAPPARTYWFRYDLQDFDYMIERPGGEIIIGRANKGRRATGDDRVTDIGPMAHLAGIVPNVLTFVKGPAEVLGSWSGILGFAKDGLPLIGRVEGSSRQWVCGGYCGLGMIRAWRSAQLLAFLVCGQPVPGEFPTSIAMTPTRLQSMVSAKL